MKKSFLLLLLIAINGWAQKTYIFDYALHFKSLSFKDSAKVENKSYLINSKDNAYFATVTTLDSLHSSINFMDYRNGVYFKIKLLKSDFITSNNIKFPIEMIHQYAYPFKNKINNYDFSLTKDTLISKENFTSYRYTSKNKKRAFRKKFGTLVYVVDKSFSFQPLLSFGTAYEDWHESPQLPSGLLKELHFYNYLNKLETSEIFINQEKIHKSFIVP